MNVLVAGGAGFIGSHLVDKLIERGDYVVAADNLCLGKKELIAHHFDNPKFRFYEIDIADNIKLNETFERDKFDRVYHLAANSDIQKGSNNPDIDIHDTFETTLSVLRSMRKFGVKEMLFSSTSAVYGDKTESLTETTGGLNPISYYGGAKLASEAFISAFAAMCDMRVNIIRFPNVVGERLTHGAIYDFIKKLKTNREELEILGDGNQEKPYIYVGDLVAAMSRLPFGDAGVNVFNAGVDSATTVRRIADIVCDEMGLSNVKYNFTGGSVGWKGDVAKFKYDLSKIHAAGWTAKYTSDEAVRLAARFAVKGNLS
jgi:UDP-glucose 4-epimerase